MEADSWGLGLAARRYFAPSDLRPFAEAGGGLRWTDLPACSHLRSSFASATGGVEYKVAERVSIEGSAGLSYMSVSQRCEFNGIVSNFNQHSLSTFRSASDAAPSDCAAIRAVACRIVARAGMVPSEIADVTPSRGVRVGSTKHRSVGIPHEWSPSLCASRPLDRGAPCDSPETVP